MTAAKTVLLSKFLTPVSILLLSALFVAKCATGTVIAGSGLVSSIGGATFVQGANHFWVTSSTPTFSGITTAGAGVSGTVGSEAVTATADGSGTWSWTPTQALSGDNQVSITSGSLTTTFTLTIGSLPESIASSSASSLAAAGSVDTTVAILSAGALFVVIGTLGMTNSFRSKN